MHSMRLFLATILAASVLGCGSSSSSATRAAASNALISDQAHNAGTPGFFFLPPMVAQPAYSGAFKAGLSPVVTIEELAPGSRGTIATFTTSSGTNGHLVKDDGVDHYQVNWDTRPFDLDPALTYRIHVVLQNFELGFADVDVVVSGNQLKNVQTNEVIPLLDGRTLPIKFRIQQEALRCVGVECRAKDPCHAVGVCNPRSGECTNPRLDGSPYFRDDFSGDVLASGWQATGGIWSVSGGILSGVAYNGVPGADELVRSTEACPTRLQAMILDTYGAPLGATGVTFNWQSVNTFSALTIRTRNPVHQFLVETYRDGLLEDTVVSDCPPGSVLPYVWYQIVLEDASDGLHGSLLDAVEGRTICGLEVPGKHIANPFFGIAAFWAGGTTEVDWIETN